MNREQLQLHQEMQKWFFRTFDDVEYCCILNFMGEVLFKKPLSKIVQVAKGRPIHYLQRELLLEAMEENVNLQGAVFVGWDLSIMNLRDIRLYGCHIKKCRFVQCNFLRCCMDHAVVTDSAFLSCVFAKGYMGNANLQRCDFTNSELRYMYLTGTTFSQCNMERSCISVSDTQNTSFIKCDLLYLEYESIAMASARFEECTHVMALPQYIPMFGIFTGWKVLFKENGAACLIELRIPRNARRFSSMVGCGRAEFAKVVRIINLDTLKEEESVINKHFVHTFYIKGKMVKPDRWNSQPSHCSNGIHFYLDPEFAIYSRSPIHYRVWDQIKKVINIE